MPGVEDDLDRPLRRRRERGAPAVLTGAFVNAYTLADELATGTHGPDLVLVGCGWEGHRAPEAAAILHRLGERGVELDGRARRVERAYLSRPAKLLQSNAAAKRPNASDTRGIWTSASPRMLWPWCRAS